MTSINTNIAAQTALRTLQSTNAQLDSTQGRISTGLKIGEAKDNAAYWSISTSLKSDNKALGTVKDALGLGAATVDTAYRGLNSTLDVLNEIKSKLTAATQAGVDRTAIQAEISELQLQLESIATASTFSGENWLSVDSSVSGYSAAKNVVSSFVRNADGSIAVGTIEIDTNTVALFDGSASADGILDGKVSLGVNVGGSGATGAVGNTNDGGLKNLITPGGQGRAAFTVVPIAAGLADGGESITFNISVDGLPNQAISLNATDINTINDAGTTAAQQGAALRDVLAGKITGATVTLVGNDIRITSNTLGGASSVLISAAVGADDASGADDTFASTFGIVNAASSVPPAAIATFDDFGGANPITLDADDAITFEVAVDGGATKSVRIDRAVVNSAISGETGGEITNIDDMVLVVRRALSDAGVTGVTVGKSTDKLTLTSGALGGTSKIAVSGVVASNSNKVASVADIDITRLVELGATSATQQKAVLTAYISVVNAALNKVTAAASNIGAVASRIELQQTFVSTLMDTIDRGVSGLIDADMNEESTRLQALQVKQQLGVQALSIANQSAQNVLSLFR